MKIVKKANIEVVKKHHLKEDDEVLYRNQVWVVTNISKPFIINKEIEIHRRDDIEDRFKKKYHEWFPNWYKIISCEETIVCNMCFNNEVDKEGEICNNCKKEQDSWVESFAP